MLKYGIWWMIIVALFLIVIGEILNDVSVAIFMASSQLAIIACFILTINDGIPMFTYLLKKNHWLILYIFITIWGTQMAANDYKRLRPYLHQRYTTEALYMVEHMCSDELDGYEVQFIYTTVQNPLSNV
jgi:hypothetical protein